MKRTTSKKSSKSSNKKQKINFKLDIRDTNILNIKWFSPNDSKENNFNIDFNPKKWNTIEIEDKH